MDDSEKIDLNIDIASIKNHDDYKKLWGKIGTIEILCVEKNEECRHNVGDVFMYGNPYMRPHGSVMHCCMCWIFMHGESRWDFLHGTLLTEKFSKYIVLIRRELSGK